MLALVDCSKSGVVYTISHDAVVWALDGNVSNS